ncbi:coproporphyrinogen III oxidase family protein [Helicobacter muridarum]|uniref:Heme chaperone HemW n=1 Tax=Helicobacter muridarum TaxID=216 RepID=A0A099TY83_9HELI|nr:radical SAM family heme chaperone HemW [Helicobacter muridarum]TLD99775.1 coproporphyrinogen III oxidase family protein [Helicobacter muridarum]STQ86991.1 oxygen-independent coproporhyrinogen III oxidase; HemN [Helicobacter muridarum]
MRIYIHIPFCDSKCGYCAFFSQTNQEYLIQDYFKALYKDIQYTLAIHNITYISSIFIGGGTPNVVPARYYESIFELLMPLCNIENANSSIEISIESNPNTLTQEWLETLCYFGVNRLSLGVQSFYSDKLILLQRAHSPRDIAHSFDLATRFLDNISLDMIYDCSLDSKFRLQDELAMALNLGISHISAYSLSIDKDSSFAKTNSNHLLRQESLGYVVRDFLCLNGALHYEVSNFALPKKCQHNLGYWNSEEYLGFGASAVSRVGTKRTYATKNLQGYIANPSYRIIEELSLRDLEFEEIFLGFRSEVGVRRKLLNQERLNIALSNNLCLEKDSRVYSKDFFIADELALYLC